MSDPTPPGQIIDRSSASRQFLGHLEHDEALKDRRAGEAGLVVRKIVHGRALREIVALNEG